MNEMTDAINVIDNSVLFISYGGGHAAALAPVARELKRRGVPIAILGLTTAAAHYRRVGLDAFGMAELIDHVAGYENVRSMGAALAATQSPHSVVSLAETHAYLGVGYSDMVRALGSAEADRQYALTGRQNFLPIEFFRRLFVVARPAAVVATSAPRSERAAIEAASLTEIPSLCLVDLYATFEIEWCAAEGFADTICVMNDVVAERFRARGVPSERVAITGNPAFDRLGDLSVASMRERQRTEMGLGHDDRLIVWISQPEPAIHPFSGIAGNPLLPRQIERQLAADFADDTNVHIVMRLHPSEDRLPEVTGPRLRYGTAAEPLDALLCAADCVVTTSSTVGLEAAMLDIPVVQITNSIFSADLPLAELGFAIAVPNQYQAAESIRELLRNATGQDRCYDRRKPVFDATASVSSHIINLL